MKTLTCSVVVMMSLLLNTSVFATDQIKLSVIEYPPFFHSNALPDGRRGVLLDLAAEAFKAVDIDATFEFLPMARTVWSVIEKKHAATLGVQDWFARENREHLVETVELLHLNFVFFYKKDKFPDGLSYENLAELKGYRIGNVRGSSTLPLFEKEGLTPELVNRLELNFKKLSADRLDLVVAVDLAGWTILTDLFPDSVGNFSSGDKALLSISAGAIFLKEEEPLMQTFRDGLGLILENGKFYDIIERYYGKDPSLEFIVPQDLSERIVKKE